MPKHVYNAKHWIFTINNPQALLDCSAIPGLRYCIYSEECNDSENGSGTNHFQGYLQFAKRTRLTALKKISELKGAHLEPQKAPENGEARNYCRKKTDPTFVDGPYEWGTFDAGTPGKRNDMADVRDMLVEKKPMLEIGLKHPGTFMRYSAGIYRLKGLIQSNLQRSEQPTVEVFYGRPGTGKTNDANNKYPDAYWIEKPNGPNQPMWWEHYDDQKTVIIDEFYGWISWSHLMRMLDRYNFKASVKGSAVSISATKFIITTNILPSQWYRKVPDFNAFVRRVSNWAYYYIDDEGTFQIAECKNYEDWKTWVINWEMNHPLPFTPPVIPTQKVVSRVHPMNSVMAAALNHFK